MTTYRFKFREDEYGNEGEEVDVDADYYKKKYNPNSRTFEYIFYYIADGKEHAIFLIPELWLVGDPIEVAGT